MAAIWALAAFGVFGALASRASTEQVSAAAEEIATQDRGPVVEALPLPEVASNMPDKPQPSEGSAGTRGTRLCFAL